MEFDLTTFVLEIVNFLVLLWLLTHFLYRPVQGALDARAQLAARQAADLASRAADLQRQADVLAREQTELQAQREAAHAALAQEVAAKRQERLDALQKELEAERIKARARFEQEQARAKQEGARAARERAAAFVASYLTRLAGPALEAAVIELFLADLTAQAVPAKQALLAAAAGGRLDLAVSTARDVTPALRQRVQAAIGALAGDTPAFAWTLDAGLIAGIRVQTASYRLEASLAHGLAAFEQPLPEAVA